MFKALSTILVRGLITLLPVLLTIYLVYWLAVTSEDLMGSLLRLVLPDIHYYPGFGMLAGVLVVFVVGLLMNAFIVRQLFALGEKIVYKLPLVKSVYGAFRDFFDFFSPNKEGLGKVVAVTINDVEYVGFITQEDTARLPEDFRDKDKALVYLPMSYMVGGRTVFVSRDKLRTLNMSMDEAMRFVLTAGITGKK